MCNSVTLSTTVINSHLDGLVDPAKSDLILLKSLPSSAERYFGRSVSITTVRTWASRGCRGVHLASRLLGGRRYTSESAIASFLQQLSVL